MACNTTSILASEVDCYTCIPLPASVLQLSGGNGQWPRGWNVVFASELSVSKNGQCKCSLKPYRLLVVLFLLLPSDFHQCIEPLLLQFVKFLSLLF